MLSTMILIEIIIVKNFELKVLVRWKVEELYKIRNSTTKFIINVFDCIQRSSIFFRRLIKLFSNIHSL